jgi:hypothetical protein
MRYRRDAGNGVVGTAGGIGGTGGLLFGHDGTNGTP